METPKYNRTYHFPWSAGAINDDKIAASIDGVIGVPIIISEKIDGSNTSLETDGCYARTHSGPPPHASFDGLKALHGAVKWKIPEGIQLFGEWAFARHSIEYSALPGYFLLFNVRDLVRSMWLSWEEVELWAQEIEVPTVPVLFRGTISSEAELKKLVLSFMQEPSCCGGVREGVVARVAAQFADDDFSRCVAKFVRANHITTDEHWKNQEIVRNKLKA
jgi:hypothetical protein